MVYDLPSLVAPPAQGELSPVTLEPMTGAERAEIEAVLERFFAAFLSGAADELEYLVPAGTQVAALGQPHELVGPVSVALAAAGVGQHARGAGGAQGPGCAVGRGLFVAVPRAVGARGPLVRGGNQ